MFDMVMQFRKNTISCLEIIFFFFKEILLATKNVICIRHEYMNNLIIAQQLHTSYTQLT